MKELGEILAESYSRRRLFAKVLNTASALAAIASIDKSVETHDISLNIIDTSQAMEQNPNKNLTRHYIAQRDQKIWSLLAAFQRCGLAVGLAISAYKMEE